MNAVKLKVISRGRLAIPCSMIKKQLATTNPMEHNSSLLCYFDHENKRIIITGTYLVGDDNSAIMPDNILKLGRDRDCHLQAKQLVEVIGKKESYTVAPSNNAIVVY